MLATAAVAASLVALTPVVVHDSRERSHLTGVAGDRGPTAYARAAPARGGGTWLQYWLFYPRQDQDRGIVRTGRHAGDWELVQYRLDEGGEPVEAVYAQHSGAERCAWSGVELRGRRPVVYAARGSHASYLRAGVRDRMWPDPNDEADGRGRLDRPRVVRISATSPAWMRRREPWGGARARWWNPWEEDSPRGPAFQPQGRWSDPSAWARSASGCRAGCDAVDECDGGETALGASGVAVLAVAGLVVARRRRRRRG
jgi:hypothetical protein